MSKIYTRGGDQGQTHLVDGSRVVKSHPRLEAYGALDELSSCLGVCFFELQKLEVIQEEKEMQNWILKSVEILIHEFLILGADLATPSSSSVKISRMDQEDVLALEEAIDYMQNFLLPLRSFVIPSSLLSSFFHEARCVARRCERCCVSIEDVNPYALSFVNRLSDFLFVVCRMVEKIQGLQEISWNQNLRMKCFMEEEKNGHS